MSADEILLDMEVGQETHSPPTAQLLEQWARSGTMAIGRGRGRGRRQKEEGAEGKEGVANSKCLYN